MVFRKRRPLRRDHVGDPSFVQGNEIELTFAHDRAVRFDEAALGLVQAKKHVAFSKKRRLGRIDVFCALGFVLQKAAAERDHFAHVIADWEHDPSAETIVGGLRFEV